MRFISRNPDRKAASRNGSRAQIVVIFAGAIIVFVGLCAIVIDVSWYWSNTLRMQRAADAAALAGVVFLPGNVPLAVSTARAEAVKNGYTDGVGGVAVTPTQDPTNSRRLKVTISGPVSTYFARAIGITTWNASRQAKADFILPVPMGSPQNYYGVGTLKGTTLVSTVTDHIAAKNSGMDVPTTSPAGTPWTASSGTLVSAVASSDANNDRTATNGATQQFGGFGLNAGPFASGESITGNMTGLQVELTNVSVSATCASTRITVALSWNGGGNWTTVTAQTALLTTTASSITFGSAASTAFWTGHTTWSASDVSDANFRVRLTGVKGCATAGTQLRIDRLRVQANYNTNTPTTAYTTPADPTARTITSPTLTVLPTQGFWGAVISKGGQRGNGDRYGPANDTAGPGGLNAEYDVNGYDYTVEVGASGRVSIYDPTYCATGTSAGGGSYGAGDHWIGAAGTPFTTVFTLYGTNGTPFDTTDDVSVATSGSMFANEIQADYSGSYGQPAGWSGPGTGTYTDCASDPYHNAWWNMKTGLAAGTYRLNVQASDAGNNGTSAENMWSVWVDGGSAPRIYGGGRMVAYNNLDAGTQLFYMAQIDAVHAGKTMVIELFDPGDVSGGASLRIKSPDGNAYNYATFSYTSDNGQPPGNNVTSITTAVGSTSYFNNSVITILINLPSTYGSTGLTPPGESLPGWWKIEYTVGGGNDTTTWQVSIRGNPVHLVLP